MTHTTDATPAPTLFAATAAENGLAGVEPAVVDEPSFAFFAHLHLPPGIGLRAAVTPDGQRAARLAADTTTDLDPEQLWYAVGRAHQRWRQLGRPAWERFGLTVTAKRQWVWLDQPTGPDTWTLDQFP